MYFLFFFLKGFLLGMTIAAIGGPVSILCIRKTIQEGLLSGIAIGFGAALADALFGFIAGFGLTIISDFLIHHQKIISLFGSIFLIYLGVTILRERLQDQTVSDTSHKKRNIFKNAALSFLITLTNPATILFFMAVALGLNIEMSNYGAIFLLIMGIFFGSVSTFSMIALIITTFYTKISYHWLMMNKIMGIGLIIFGIVIGVKNIF